MISEGNILLFRFPQSDLGVGKLRPALLIKRIHGDFDDCLVCMISTQTRHQIAEMEVVLPEAMPGFKQTGLKKESLVRTSRVAVVQGQTEEYLLVYALPQVLDQGDQHLIISAD